MKKELKEKGGGKKSAGDVAGARRILVPVDFSRLSGEAVSQAVLLARHNGSEVLLVHVVEPVVMYPMDSFMLTAPAVVPMGDTNLQVLKIAKERLARLREEIEAQGVKCQALTTMGKPFHEIVEAARKKRADLIVIPTHGHTGLKHIYLGSTAEKVVRHAPCSVLVVR